MLDIQSKILRLESLVKTGLNESELLEAMKILGDLKIYAERNSDSQKKPESSKPLESQSNQVLEELHDTQVSLLKLRMQNEALLSVMHDCHSTLESSHTTTAKLLSTANYLN